MGAPRALRNSRSQARLSLEWDDGEQQISHTRLRGACPCSQCKAARLRGVIGLVDQDVRLERIALQGYGVQLVFSDGHERGIYPWEYLRDLGGAGTDL
ncbi:MULTISPECIES: gamma-butyrobetaine hydroxylase-like domain-containing protein [unclassified Pseudomonas]|jgi:DUF971 family protein|uniref:DUF971 domain-containing protein n=1 Tax=unclassified Pseudomonas TaxID=196821 RepID=UPI00129E999F|nr:MULTISPECIES: gamma-butyrobetaine hydroxylase-like domain-containing protein [unclassified Pseudomonas]MDH4651826.1 DUF971 domain-containing protein [Pseudomonas sp. BN606]MRK21736.1 DUF971 domain-containing protein [Pseudomonas sp. JG-B]